MEARYRWQPQPDFARAISATRAQPSWPLDWVPVIMLLLMILSSPLWFDLAMTSGLTR